MAITPGFMRFPFAQWALQMRFQENKNPSSKGGVECFKCPLLDYCSVSVKTVTYAVVPSELVT